MRGKKNKGNNRSVFDNKQLMSLISSDYMAKILKETREVVRKKIATLGFEEAFTEVEIKNKSGMKKKLLKIDLIGETEFKDKIKGEDDEFNGDLIQIYGEESLNYDPDLTGLDNVCILADIIDGTDLLTRQMSNWCSAIVVYSPKDQHIHASFVMMQTDLGEVMYYTHPAGGAYRTYIDSEEGDRNYGHTRLSISENSRQTQLKDSSICIYGQKIKNASSMAKFLLSEKLQTITKKKSSFGTTENKEDDPKFRIYNLAGNPMMCRLADNIVNIVLDLEGQAPHDVVPGAFIALHAGANLIDLQGNEITEKLLAKYLLKPGSQENRIKYILSSNKNLSDEICDVISNI